MDDQTLKIEIAAPERAAAARRSVEELLAACEPQMPPAQPRIDPRDFHIAKWERFAHIMQEPYDPDAEPRQWRGQPGFDVMLRQLKKKAENGDLKAIQMVLEYQIGKAVQRTENVEIKVGIEEWRQELHKHSAQIAANIEHARQLEANRWKRNPDSNLEELPANGDIVDATIRS